MDILALRTAGAEHWRTHIRLRSRAVLTLSAVVVAAFALGACFLYQHALKDRQAITHRAVASAITSAHNFDREVVASASLAKGLSKSPALAADDLRAFHDQLVATPAPEGSWFLLWDRERQVLNSRRSFGATLPTRADFGGGDENWNRIRSQGITVADRTLSPTSNTFVVAVNLRIDGAAGEMKGFLTVILPESRLSAVVRENPLPPEWVTTIVDRALAPIATSGDDHWVGRELPKELQDRLRSGPGSGHFVSHDGSRDALVAFYRSATSGFTTVTSVPLALAQAPLTEALQKIALAGAVLLLAGGLAGVVLARQVGPVEGATATARRLRLAEARYASLWNDTPEGLFVVTVLPTGRFVFEGLNRVHEQATGLKFDDIAGKEPEECLPAATAAAVLARYRHCVATGQPQIYDEVLDLPGGRRHWQTSLAPVRDPETARIVLLVGTARDVTTEREKAAELGRLNERLQSILSSVSDCYCTFDREFRVTAINPAALQWLGLPEREVLEASFAEAYAGPHECAKVTRRVMKDRVPVHVEVPSGTRSGRWLDYHVYPSPEGVSVFFRDITEAKAAREALETMSRQLLASQEEERRRIASELHDSTGPHLVAITLNLMRLGASTGETLNAIRQEIEGSVQEALKELRVFTYLLHPPRLRSDGLRATLQQFVEGFAHRAGFRATLHASPALDRLSEDLQHCVFRVVQEALSNAHRHASATHVGISAKLVRGALILRIKDNGRGMSAETVHDSDRPLLGVGIPGMRARLQQFGGDVTIRSRPTGTTLLAVAPLPPSTPCSNSFGDSSSRLADVA